MRKLISFSLLLAFLSSFGVRAALPPLSEEARKELSDNIVSAVVIGVQKVGYEEGPGVPKNIFQARIAVTGSEKGENIKKGTHIRVQFRRIDADAAGSIMGPIGQSQMIKRDTTIRAYIQTGEDGVMRLLEPNGFDVIE